MSAPPLIYIGYVYNYMYIRHTTSVPSVERYLQLKRQNSTVQRNLVRAFGHVACAGNSYRTFECAASKSQAASAFLLAFEHGFCSTARGGSCRKISLHIQFNSIEYLYFYYSFVRRDHLQGCLFSIDLHHNLSKSCLLFE